MPATRWRLGGSASGRRRRTSAAARVPRAAPSAARAWLLYNLGRVREPSEHTEDLDGLPVFWREAPAPAGDALPPVLYLHGVPSNSDEWTPWLALTGGVAVTCPASGAPASPAR